MGWTILCLVLYVTLYHGASGQANLPPCPSSPITATWYLKAYDLHCLLTEDQKLYFVRPSGELRAGPIPMSNYIPKFRVRKVDAVFTHDLLFDNLRDYTFVFSGSSYSVYERFHYVDGPHSINSGSGPLKLRLPNYVRKIDAALTWHENGKVYLFSGSQYWSYDIINNRLDSGYPRMTRDFWRGFGNRPDAAIRLDRERTTYFFSGYRVYKANDQGVVASGYPKGMGNDLFKCKRI